MEPMFAMSLAIAPWVATAILTASSGPKRIKRGPARRPVRDQFTPEEIEAHWDELRRRRSGEIKALKYGEARAVSRWSS